MSKLFVKKPELLAPAGNLEKLKWALKYGADAVYIGGQKYSLRANNDNFSLAEIKQACQYASKYQAKVYVTINIIFHDEDINGLTDYLKSLVKCGVKAIIISDPFIIDLVKEAVPTLDLFLSTQQSTLNYESVLFWQKQGIKRIILAREASKQDIKEIVNKTKMPLEVFIQGAMCVNYSGKCVLSNFLTNRDSNRGGCSQICRWAFTLYDYEGKPITNKEDFMIAPKDLSLIEQIPTLINLGVASFKIEGRMRSLYYLATVVKIYRQIIDEYCANPQAYKYNLKQKAELFRCANRPVAAQYFLEKPTFKEQYYSGRIELSNQDFLGIVKDYNEKEKYAVIEQRNFFKVGAEVEIFGPQQEPFSFKIKEIRTEQGILLEAARHPQQIVYIPLLKRVNKDDIMRVKINASKTL